MTTLAPAPTVAQLDLLRRSIRACERCELRACANEPVPFDYPMPVESSGPRVMVVGRNPGYTEDRRGFPFVGPAGKLLDEWLKHAGLTRGQDVIVTNLVKCLSPQNREPSPHEISTCVSWLLVELQLFRPQLVIGLGAQVCQTLTGQPLKSRRGLIFESADGTKASTMMSYHPSAALRSLTFKAALFADAVPVRRWLEDRR